MVTERMLIKQLKKLGNDRLILRKDYNEVPPRVKCSISPLGKTLEDLFAAMHIWGQISKSQKLINRFKKDIK